MPTFPSPNFMYASFSETCQIRSPSAEAPEYVKAIVSEDGKVYEMGTQIQPCAFGSVNYVMELHKQQDPNHYTRSNRIFAAKFINIAEYASRGGDFPEQPLEEIACYQHIARLGGHPNIVKLENALLLLDWYVIIMEHVSGGDLLSHVQLEGVIPAVRLSRYISMLCSALSFLHAHGICHRDLSCENILYCIDTDSIKMVDFGMSFLHNGVCSPSREVYGKADYLAPELLKNIQYHPPPVDMWAIGVICFLCLVYRFPLPPGYHYVLVTDEDIHNCMQRVLVSIHAAIPGDAYDFIRDVLRVSPEQRRTALQALEHVWLSI